MGLCRLYGHPKSVIKRTAFEAIKMAQFTGREGNTADLCCLQARVLLFVVTFEAAMVTQVTGDLYFLTACVPFLCGGRKDGSLHRCVYIM